MCITGSCDVGMLSVAVELAAGVAGCAGTELAAVGAVCAVGGGGLAAAGPERVGSVGCVDDAAVEDLGAVEDMPIEGSGCPGMWNFSYFSNCRSNHAFPHGSSEYGGGSSGCSSSSSSLEM